VAAQWGVSVTVNNMDKIILAIFILMVGGLVWYFVTTDTCNLPTQYISATKLKECLEI